LPPTVPFGGTNISCALAIGKYSTDGIPLGATPIAQRTNNSNPSGFSTPYAVGMTVHPSNGLYCTLVFHGPMTFGSTNLNGRTDSSPYDDYALLKLSAAGEVEWVRQIKGSGAPFVMSRPALDDEGNVFVAGSFVDMVSFDVTNLTSPSVYTSFLAKYSPQGDLLRVTGIGRGSFLRAWNVALDHNANCYVSMFFQEQAIFGATTFSNRVGAYYNAFLKCDANGQVLWARQTSEGSACLVAVDRLGAAYAGDETSSHQTQYSKYDADGNLLWQRTGPDVHLHALCVDSSGSCYLFGQPGSSSADFDGLTATNIWRLSDAALTRLSSTIAPRLEIQVAAGALTLSWTALADDYHLESTTDVSATNSWARSDLGTSTLNARNIATTNLPPSPLFFRLSRN
jgi:hypothetical protein